jgi:hypothetical protein
MTGGVLVADGGGTVGAGVAPLASLRIGTALFAAKALQAIKLETSRLRTIGRNEGGVCERDE